MTVAVSILLLLLLCYSTPSTGADPCHDEAVVEAIRNGDFSAARYYAHQSHSASSTCTSSTSSLSQLYICEADNFLKHNNPNHNHLPISKRKKLRLESHVDRPDCWNLNFNGDKIAMHTWWDRCCSQLFLFQSGKNKHDNSSVRHPFNTERDHSSRCQRSDGSRLCCELSRGSSTYLHLPLLNELAVRLRVETDIIGTTYGGPARRVETYNLEQDGFLRKYDVAGILWPTGYLLGLCVAGPDFCGVPEIHHAIEASATTDDIGTNIAAASSRALAVELGAGIGVPSIVLARSLGISVVATDQAPHALALTSANSQAANASVQTALLDHFNATDVVRFLEELASPGFAVVLGSSLQAMFDVSTEDPEHQLWKTLELLLDPANPHAVALLAHSIKTLQPPRDGGFRHVRTISGNLFGMKTRYGKESDFEISVFQRRFHKLTSMQDQDL